MAQLTADDFEALGIYDPRAPLAARRLELLEYLVGLGAKAEDLVANRDVRQPAGVRAGSGQRVA